MSHVRFKHPAGPRYVHAPTSVAKRGRAQTRSLRGEHQTEGLGEAWEALPWVMTQSLETMTSDGDLEINLVSCLGWKRDPERSLGKQSRSSHPAPPPTHLGLFEGWCDDFILNL